MSLDLRPFAEVSAAELADLEKRMAAFYRNPPARWKARARRTPPGAFWIKTRPSKLHGAVHGIDTDAIHLPRLADLKWWFLQRGGQIVTTSRIMDGIDPAVLRYNCYVLATKATN